GGEVEVDGVERAPHRGGRLDQVGDFVDQPAPALDVDGAAHLGGQGGGPGDDLLAAHGRVGDDAARLQGGQRRLGRGQGGGGLAGGAEQAGLAPGGQPGPGGGD